MAKQESIEVLRYFQAVMIVALSLILVACGGNVGTFGPPNDGANNPAVVASGCAKLLEDSSVNRSITLFNTDSTCDYYIPGFVSFGSLVNLDTDQ